MKNIPDLFDRLCILVPWPDCDTFGNDYDAVVWRDERPIPTIDELQAVDTSVGLPDVVPAAVDRWQARVALINAGLLDKVELCMADPGVDVVAREAWSGATSFRRDSVTVAAMGVALGMADLEIDALFIAASKVEG